MRWFQLLKSLGRRKSSSSSRRFGSRRNSMQALLSRLPRMSIGRKVCASSRAIVVTGALKSEITRAKSSLV